MNCEIQTCLCSLEWAIDRIQYWWRKMHEAYNIELTNPPSAHVSTRLKTTAGLASIKQNLIVLNQQCLANEMHDNFDQTIGHEVAHIFAYKRFGVGKEQAHGQIWQEIMLRVGLEPRRCHNYTSVRRTPQVRINYTCQCGKLYKVSKNLLGRMRNGKKYKCVCGNQVTITMQRKVA